MLFKSKEFFRKILSLFGLLYVGRSANYRFGINHFRDWNELLNTDKPLIIDVGANVGQTVKDIYKIFPKAKVISYEPAKKTFQSLMKVSTPKQGNFIPVNAGLGKVPDLLNLYTYDKSDLNSFLPINEFDNFKETGSEKCQILTLDNEFNRLNIEYIDVLKIDTQGYELDVLKGAKKILEQKKIQLIYCEVNFKEVYKGNPKMNELLSYLSDLDYSLVTIYPCHIRSRRAVWAEMLFEVNSVAN